MMSIDFDKYFAAGEIMNPEYEHLKKVVSRAIEKEYGALKDSNRPTSVDDKYKEFWYFHPSVLNISTLGKRIKLLKLNRNNNEYEREIIEFYEKYYPISENFKKLKNIVKKTTEKRAEVKERKQKELVIACEVDPLTKALIVYHDDFVKAAMKSADEQYISSKKYLLDNGGIEKVAPYPSRAGSREAYMMAMEIRQFYEVFLRLTKEEYVNAANRSAHDEYMAWVCKMAAKVGKKAIEAKMIGNRADVSPWQSSDLIVKTEDGETQKWYTQRIINRSKYGKNFYQFPSRRYV